MVNPCPDEDANVSELVGDVAVSKAAPPANTSDAVENPLGTLSVPTVK